MSQSIKMCSITHIFKNKLLMHYSYFYIEEHIFLKFEGFRLHHDFFALYIIISASNIKKEGAGVA